LKNVLSQNGKIFIDSLVLSEFVNRYVRLAYNESPNRSTAKFKDFRQSAEYEQIAISIKVACKKILEDTRPIDTDLNHANLNKILDNF
jgi:hypothetical protein